jgi:O-antigen/teichoic acid export membrane protein
VDIKSSVIQSLGWLASARVIGQAISWASTIMVIRMLTPGDYGLMAMAMMVVGLFMLLNDMGLAMALVQQRHLDQKAVPQVFGLTLLLNAGLFVILAMIAPLIAAFFAEPQLTDILRTLGLQFLLGSIGSVQAAMLARAMDFKGRSIADLMRILAASITTLLLAWKGYGVWALVGGQLAGVICWSLYCAMRAHYFCLPSFRFDRSQRQLFAFGSFMTVNRILWYAYSQSDILIVGRLLGNTELGRYMVAMHLASLPMQKVGDMLNEVGFAAFSRIQEDSARVSAYLYKALKLVSLISFPVFFGISAVAKDLTELVLGSGWEQSAHILHLVSLIMPLRMLGNTAPSALLGIGRPDVGTRNMLATLVVMSVAFLVGSRWGLMGIVAVWILVYPILFAAIMYFTLPVVGLSLGVLARITAKPFVCAGLMWLVVVGLASALRLHGVPPLASVLVQVASGVVFFLALAAFWDRQALIDLRGLVRRGA